MGILLESMSSIMSDEQMSSLFLDYDVCRRVCGFINALEPGRTAHGAMGTCAIALNMSCGEPERSSVNQAEHDEGTSTRGRRKERAIVIHETCVSGRRYRPVPHASS